MHVHHCILQVLLIRLRLLYTLRTGGNYTLILPVREAKQGVRRIADASAQVVGVIVDCS